MTVTSSIFVCFGLAHHYKIVLTGVCRCLCCSSCYFMFFNVVPRFDERKKIHFVVVTLSPIGVGEKRL